MNNAVTHSINITSAIKIGNEGTCSLQLFATPPPIIATIKNAANHPNFPVL